MLTFNDRIKQIADKMCLWYFIKNMSHMEMYEFFCDYLFGDKTFNILEHDFEYMNKLIDKSLGDDYITLLSIGDRLEIYDLATEICKEKINE